MNQNTFCSKCHRIPTQCCCSSVRELSDEEILDAMCLNDTDLMVLLEQTPYAKEKMIQRGRALLKKASEK